MSSVLMIWNLKILLPCLHSLNSTGKSIGNGKWQITRILTFLLLSNGKLPFPCSFFHWNEKQWRYFLSIAVSAMDDARQLRVFPQLTKLHYNHKISFRGQAADWGKASICLKERNPNKFRQVHSRLTLSGPFVFCYLQDDARNYIWKKVD